MQEQIAPIPAPGGVMNTFITHPDEGGPFPAVLVFMDFWGVREELYDIARAIAVAGHAAVVPDFYYRQGAIHNEVRDQRGRMVSLNRLDQATKARVLAPLHKLSDGEAMDDTAAALQFLDGCAFARPGPKGCVGYCLGGRLVMRAAAQFPEQFKACASLHGSALVTERDDSPHRLAGRFQGEFYCGFAEHDPYTPPSTAADIAAAIKSGPARYRYEVHAGTEHGYALPNRDIYDKRATLRDWEIILAMFRRQLGA
jgi:carboxymethylenebutenolidase